MDFPKLNLPLMELKTKLVRGDMQVFDTVRKKYFSLTSEEWVRQNIVLFLVHELNVPLSHIAIERGLKVNNLNKRFDIVVFDKYGKVNILIECKSPNVKLNQKSIDQLVIYNFELKSKFLMLSNGLKHIFLKFNNNNFKIINSLPKYTEL